jgi:hypothetical protein
MDNSDKSAQLERDFGIQHPLKALRAGLRKRDDREVTPLQVTCMRREFAELEGLGLDEDDAILVVLMGGGRIEVIAAMMFGIKWDQGEDADEVEAQARYRLQGTHPEYLIPYTWRKLNLLRRA